MANKHQPSAIETTKHFRRADFSGAVNVTQKSLPVREQESKMLRSKIWWDSYLVGKETAQDFVNVMQAAIEIATKWDKDIGKPASEILQVNEQVEATQ